MYILYQLVIILIMQLGTMFTLIGDLIPLVILSVLVCSIRLVSDFWIFSLLSCITLEDFVPSTLGIWLELLDVLVSTLFKKKCCLSSILLVIQVNYLSKLGWNWYKRFIKFHLCFGCAKIPIPNTLTSKLVTTPPKINVNIYSIIVILCL